MSGTNRDDSWHETVEEKILLPSGDVLLRHYRKGKCLGRGGFAACYEFTALDTHKRMAAKVVPKNTIEKGDARQRLMSEIKIHSGLRHKGIVSFEHYFEDNENVYILLELCNPETMNQILRRRRRLSEVEVQSHVVQLVEALQYMQSRRVVHRDLKLDNIFLNERMEIKIGDFGLAAKIEHRGTRRKTLCGTPNYTAPEVLDIHTGHTYKADIWSLGVIIYALLVGKPPFDTPDVESTYNRIRSHCYSFPDSVPLSPASKSLISRLLVAEEQRLSLEEILRTEFLNPPYTIPRVMPATTITAPLPPDFLQALVDSETKTMEEPGKVESAKEESKQNSAIEVLPQSDFPPPPEPQSEDPLPPAPDPPISPDLPRSQHRSATPVWVVKWLDFTSRYGLGYLLSDGCVGVNFNDISKIVQSHAGGRLAYMERGSAEVTYESEAECPSSLHKKLKILQHFRSFLVTPQLFWPEPSHQRSAFHYVKKWVKTKRAVLFRLSNKAIQVMFDDKYEVLLSSDTSILTYVNSERVCSNHQLDQAQVDPESDIAKRVQYTLQMLGQMLRKSHQLTKSI